MNNKYVKYVRYVDNKSFVDDADKLEIVADAENMPAKEKSGFKNISYELAREASVELVKLCRKIFDENKDFTFLAPMVNQVTRSSSSVVANIAEVSNSNITAKHKFYKLNIALSECYETISWVEMLFEQEYFNEEEYTNFRKKYFTIAKILGKGVGTLKKELSKQK